MTENLHSYCPECDTRIRFYKRPKLGALVTCPECDEVLEVVSIRPIELEWTTEGFYDDDNLSAADSDWSTNY
jgi:lysine biosynthesis protein LysW